VYAQAAVLANLKGRNTRRGEAWKRDRIVHKQVWPGLPRI
jgi:hypothetical protein